MLAAALAPLLGAAFTVAACYATGVLVIQRLGVSLRRAEKFPLAFVLGAACLHLAMFGVLALKIAYKPVLFVLLAGLIVAAALSRQARPDPWPSVPWTLKIGFGLIFAVFTAVYFVLAWAPETSPDGSRYHLELVARYLREHGFVRITTNMYAGLGQGVEMLFVPAFAFGRNSAAALVHLAFAIALALAMFAYGRRIGKPWVGAAGALLTYLSPIVGKTAPIAYVDAGVAAIAFAVFYWLEIWDEERNARLLIPIGLLAGYGYAAKYTAFVMVLYALGFVAWRSKKLRPLLVVGSCAAVMIAPWAIKDWIYLHNPVAPFGNQIFRNPNFPVLTEQRWTETLRRYTVANKWTLPIEVTVRGGRTQGIVGPAFLAVPLVLLALRYRAGRRLLWPGLLLLATYLGNVGTRFLIPCLPFLSLGIAMALGNVRWLLALLVVFHTLASWPQMVPRYANRYAWRIDSFPLQAALRRIPEDVYLRASLGTYPMARMVEDHVPPGERVLSLNGFSQVYTSRDVLVSFQASFNAMLADSLYTGWMEELQPSRTFVFRFPERSMRRVRLLQTARAKSLPEWSVHELRFLDGGVELPRTPVWRLRAFPNPWEVQLAFDNSPVTRWKSAEAPAPGMYLDADFGRMEAVDEVRVESSHENQGPIRLQVETMDPQGRWVKVADSPDERPLHVRAVMRRSATYEMQARGVHYLMIQDDDLGAGDFRREAESWGLTVVATVPGATLYQVAP